MTLVQLDVEDPEEEKRVSKSFEVNDGGSKHTIMVPRFIFSKQMGQDTMSLLSKWAARCSYAASLSSGCLLQKHRQ